MVGPLLGVSSCLLPAVARGKVSLPVSAAVLCPLGWQPRSSSVGRRCVVYLRASVKKMCQKDLNFDFGREGFRR